MSTQTRNQYLLRVCDGCASTSNRDWENSGWLKGEARQAVNPGVGPQSRSHDLVGARNMREVNTKSPSPHRAEYLLLAFHAPSPVFALCFLNEPVPIRNIMNNTSFFNDQNVPQSSNTLASDNVAPLVPVIPGQTQTFFPTRPHVQYQPSTVSLRASQARPSGPPIRHRPRTNHVSTDQSLPTAQLDTHSFSPAQISAAQAQGLPKHNTPEKNEMAFINDEAPDACDEFGLLKEAEEPCRMTLNWLALFG